MLESTRHPASAIQEAAIDTAKEEKEEQKMSVLAKLFRKQNCILFCTEPNHVVTWSRLHKCHVPLVKLLRKDRQWQHQLAAGVRWFVYGSFSATGLNKASQQTQ